MKGMLLMILIAALTELTYLAYKHPLAYVRLFGMLITTGFFIYPGPGMPCSCNPRGGPDDPPDMPPGFKQTYP